MDALFAFCLLALAITAAITCTTHHARLRRHYQARPSSSQCSAVAASMLTLERGGVHGVDVIPAGAAHDSITAARGPCVVLPSCDLDDVSVAAMADAAAGVGEYLHRASRGWPHRLEVTARTAGAAALVVMVPAVALSWLPGPAALWVVAVCAAVMAGNEAVFAWRRHHDHVVGAAQLELARVVRRGDELAAVATLLRWRLAAPCGAAAVFGTVAGLAVAAAVR
jgi:hypothetical protein